ncbi:unnamed protein product [Bursaphelenchus xylophilus]|uniref:Protein tweety homolog n=1 Tax=Bursaphelenchus xylophilus TaxID=6326 RepID=A0A1I7ST21_BURXY|nr:unnamed protein product [Bursaphelenchus xylophilus]CAG9108787.1 unnamed protein product [Bursaphelenchus xylophilus]
MAEDWVIWLRQLIHRIPHLDYQFKRVDNVFVFDIHDTYFSALTLFCLAALILGLLFLFIVVIVWSISCCTSKAAGNYSRQSIRRLTYTLFIMNIICFALLAACLYGNDHSNRAMISKVVPQLREVDNNLDVSKQKLDQFDKAKDNVSRDASQLKSLIDEEEKKPGVNKTKVLETNAALDRIVNLWKDLQQTVEGTKKVLYGLKNLKDAEKKIDRMEFERWIMVVTLLSIMFVVLFAGVLAICKNSRTGVVAFSGLGIVVFFLAWVIFSLAAPLTIAYADFCETGRSFVSNYLPDGVYNVLSYYEKCVDGGLYTQNINDLNIDKIDTLLTEIKAQDSQLESASIALFGDNKLVATVIKDIAATTDNGLKNIGTVATLSSCTSNHNRVHQIIHGFCRDGFLGNLIFLVGIFVFGIFMGFLLMVASRSWFAFERKSTDYTEVSDEDPFYPRAAENSVSADIYGTHLGNPRFRYGGNSTDNNTESTGTNSGGQAIGEQHTPLLDHSTWRQHNDVNPSSRYC